MRHYLNYIVYPKENLYFNLKLIVSILIYGALISFFAVILSNENVDIPLPVSISLGYLGLIIFILFIHLGLLIGYIKGNAVKISEKQFPDIYNIVVKQSKILNIKTIPKVFILESGGILNAFATRFLGTNYIVIYSNVLEQAYEKNIQTVEFIIGHELGHIKRKHLIKNLLLAPSCIIPLLQSAYSRACEYTCDNIGASLSEEGIINGLSILAAGPKLYKKLNVEEFKNQTNNEASFWSWIAEKLSSHPRLTKRIAKLNMKKKNHKRTNEEPQQEDPNRYMPI